MDLLRAGMARKMLPLSPKDSVLVAAVDVGTSKTVCLIARLEPHLAQQALPRRTHSTKVLAVGHINNQGMKAGAVVDSEQVEKTVRQVIDLAERPRRLQVRSALVSVSGGRIETELLSGSVDVSVSYRTAMSCACLLQLVGVPSDAAAPDSIQCRLAFRPATFAASVTHEISLHTVLALTCRSSARMGPSLAT